MENKIAIHKPDIYHLEHIDSEKNTVEFTGTAKQIIKYIVNQQL